MENKEERIVYISRKKTIKVVIIVLVILAIFFFGSKLLTRRYDLGVNSTMMLPTVPSIDTAMMPAPYERPQNNNSVKDTREFMKVAYSAQIKTRDVSSVMKDAENAVRNAEGRVDNISSSTKYGYLSFVVPKSNFYQFKDEIEKLTSEKLITETVSSQNLLGEKQGIEQEADNIVKSLTDLQKEKTSLTTAHTKTLASLNNQITENDTDLASIRSLISGTTDTTLLATYRKQETILLQKESALTQSKNQENSTYSAKIATLNNSINRANNNLDNNTQRDVQFGDKIETVSGNINVNWVSIWKIAEIYSPVPMSIVVIILIIVVWYLLRVLKLRPRFKFN